MTHTNERRLLVTDRNKFSRMLKSRRGLALSYVLILAGLLVIGAFGVRSAVSIFPLPSFDAGSPLLWLSIAASVTTVGVLFRCRANGLKLSALKFLGCIILGALLGVAMAGPMSISPLWPGIVVAVVAGIGIVYSFYSSVRAREKLVAEESEVASFGSEGLRPVPSSSYAPRGEYLPPTILSPMAPILRTAGASEEPTASTAVRLGSTAPSPAAVPAATATYPGMLGGRRTDFPDNDSGASKAEGGDFSRSTLNNL